MIEFLSCIMILTITVIDVVKNVFMYLNGLSLFQLIYTACLIIINSFITGLIYWDIPIFVVSLCNSARVVAALIRILIFHCCDICGY